MTLLNETEVENHLATGLEDQMQGLLEQMFRIKVRTASLDDLAGIYYKAPRKDLSNLLVVADATTASQRCFLYAHVIAHLVLGHDEAPCATILEPRIDAQGQAQLNLPDDDLCLHAAANAWLQDVVERVRGLEENSHEDSPLGWVWNFIIIVHDELETKGGWAEHALRASEREATSVTW